MGAKCCLLLWAKNINLQMFENAVFLKICRSKRNKSVSGLFNDAVSSSVCVASDCRMTYELEKTRMWPNLMHYSSIYIEELKKIMKNFQGG
jgi:hypothetical protein